MKDFQNERSQIRKLQIEEQLCAFILIRYLNWAFILTGVEACTTGVCQIISQ